MRRAAALATASLGLAISAGAPAADDTERGARVFQRCYACHSLDPAEGDLQGPNLHGLIGRRAGALPEFEYSPAMAEAGRTRGLVWTPQTLDAFLADPERVVPGTAMPPLLPALDPAARADLIAYLARARE